jgi:predicted GIY-YIG superfamily endonuclease
MNADEVPAERWYVYIVRCSDDTLYTGVTVDIAKRLYAHNTGKGAKYTASRSPVSLRHSEGPMTRSDALRREMEIKRMSRSNKVEVSGS